jgi:hypothetical protein
MGAFRYRDIHQVFQASPKFDSARSVDFMNRKYLHEELNLNLTSGRNAFGGILTGHFHSRSHARMMSLELTVRWLECRIAR